MLHPSWLGPVDPFTPDRHQCSHDHRTQKQAEQAKGFNSAENPDQCPKEGQAHRPANKTELNEVVSAYHHYGTPAEEETTQEQPASLRQNQQGCRGKGKPRTKWKHRKGNRKDGEKH